MMLHLDVQDTVVRFFDFLLDFSCGFLLHSRPPSLFFI
jgi:hypothetical protein